MIHKDEIRTILLNSSEPAKDVTDYANSHIKFWIKTWAWSVVLIILFFTTK